MRLQFWKTKEVSDKEQQHKLRVEAGFGEIDTQEDLHARLKFIQEPFVEMANILIKEREKLAKEKPDKRTPQTQKRIEDLDLQIFNLLLHKTNKIVATAWSIAAEDRDMSERYSASEKFFARNWGDPTCARLLMATELYLQDISFREKHVGPAPHILTQTPITPYWKGPVPTGGEGEIPEQ